MYKAWIWTNHGFLVISSNLDLWVKARVRYAWVVLAIYGLHRQSMDCIVQICTLRAAHTQQ